MFDFVRQHNRLFQFILLLLILQWGSRFPRPTGAWDAWPALHLSQLEAPPRSRGTLGATGQGTAERRGSGPGSGPWRP